MAKSPDKLLRVAPSIEIRGKGINYPPGQRPRGKTMAQQEREEARRRWLLISGALFSALAAGVLIGRFLIP